jgi:integrase
MAPCFGCWLSGQRKSEVAEARWSEIDIEGKVWTIPAERMKADAAHVVPLTEDAIEIIKWKRANTARVAPAHA